MPRISEETIVAVKEATDIVSVISEYVRDLKASGKNYKARCPFHNEKTPSFMVNPERQSFRCFGCGQSGNVISFLMKMDQITFPEAIRQLASRAGIPLKEQEQEGEITQKRELLFRINHWAMQWYHHQLQGSDGIKAQKYLKERGFSAETISSFSLGYAPDSWEALLQAGQRQDLNQEDLVEAGLLVVKDSQKIYDRFRDRLMFPILDARQRVVGFGGRTFDSQGVKYVNTPESAIFKKSHHLYGLHLAAQALRSQRKALLVEGYTDVMMAHQYGFSHVVAALGTALTADHAKLLKRWVDEVVLVLDGDEAGRQAAWRGIPLLLAADLNVTLITLPEGQDPCDCLQQQGSENFQRLIDQAVDPIDLAFSKLSVSPQPGEIHRVLQSLTQLCQNIHSPIKRELFLQKISRLSGLKEQTLEKEVRLDIQNDDPPKIRPPATLNEDQEPPAEERGLVTAFMMEPQKILHLISHLENVDVTHPHIRRLLAEMLSCLEKQPEATSDYLEALFQDSEDMDLVSRCREEASGDCERLFLDCIHKLKQKRIKVYEKLAQKAREADDLLTYRKYERQRYLLTQELKQKNIKKIVNNA